MASTNETIRWEGGCPCKEVRYALTASPLIVHCCHCTWCQKESGAAFALNAVIETREVELLSKIVPERVPTPSESKRGQFMARCPTCKFVVWSNYGPEGDFMRFVRVGTLDNPSNAPPSVHIFTSTKQEWLELTGSIPIFPEYYKREEVWPQSSIDRRTRLMETLSEEEKA